MLVAKKTNLYKYTNHIYYDNIDRHILFEKCLKQIIHDYSIVTINKIYFYLHLFTFQTPILN